MVCLRCYKSVSRYSKRTKDSNGTSNSSHADINNGQSINTESIEANSSIQDDLNNSESNQDTNLYDSSTIAFSTDSIKINIKRTKIKFKSCVICNTNYLSKKLHRINQSAILDAFLQTNILIPSNSRACSDHFENANTKSRFISSAIEMIIEFKESIELNSQQIGYIIEGLRKENNFSNLRSRFSSPEKIDSEECKKLTGNAKCFVNK